MGRAWPSGPYLLWRLGRPCLLWRLGAPSLGALTLGPGLHWLGKSCPAIAGQLFGRLRLGKFLPLQPQHLGLLFLGPQTLGLLTLELLLLEPALQSALIGGALRSF